MIKHLCFDCDGVLYDTNQIHFKALNQALIAVFGYSSMSIPKIIWTHAYENEMQGWTTKQKLKYLQELHEFDPALLSEIDALKQTITLRELSRISYNSILVAMLKNLRNLGYTLTVGSNSRQENVFSILRALKIVLFFDDVLCGDNGLKPKPSPEIFQALCNGRNVLAKNTLVIEDSHSGIEAAIAGGMCWMKVNSAKDVTLNSVLEQIAYWDHLKKDKQNALR